MHNIKVDDEVFAYLQRLAKPFVDQPNDVLRRELLGDKPRVDVSPTTLPPRRPGALMPFIESGSVAECDPLTFTQTRRKVTHRAVVTADGWIAVEGGREYDAPSPALKECVGHDINGWNWVHGPSGKTLNTLRNEAA